MSIQNIVFKIILLTVLLNIPNPGYAVTDDKPLIFPIPKDITLKQGRFIIDESSFIILPEKPGDNDVFLARLLVYE
ncbi:MAG: hypothetical protein EOO92_18115, partial [Pedobacter sp.]